MEYKETKDRKDSQVYVSSHKGDFGEEKKLWNKKELLDDYLLFLDKDSNFKEIK